MVLYWPRRYHHVGDQSIPNPAFTTWNDFDQRAVILLNSSLTEEAAAEVLGLTTAHAIWTALETTYSNSSVERIHSLRDSLRNLSKGTSTVSDYGRQFKAESHEMFLKSLHGSATPPAAFFSQQSGSGSSQGRQQRQQNYSRGGVRASNSNGGRGRGGQSVHYCQLFSPMGTEKHSSSPSLHIIARMILSTSDANLAQAFTSQCHVTQGHPDWYVDSGARLHMTSSPDNCLAFSPHSGRENQTGELHMDYVGRWDFRCFEIHPMALAANVGVLKKSFLNYGIIKGPPISDAPVPESRPTDTRPSSSSPCGLCPVPTTAAEPIHEPDSTPSSPYSSEDDNPPTDSDDVSSHGAPPATAPTSLPTGIQNLQAKHPQWMLYA
ncbi:zinc finger, CCHC-type containing LTR copia-type gag-polypeptide [Tanacetum coccineum]